MGQVLIAHICKICGSARKTRDRAKKHVNRQHSEQVSHRHGPGQHVRYLWLDLENHQVRTVGGDHGRTSSRTMAVRQPVAS